MINTFEHTTEPDCICDSCCEASHARREVEQEAIAAYEGISRFINRRNAPELVHAIARDHRTPQQGFTALCVAWLDHLSALTDDQYDLRNAASVDLARAITKTTAWDKSRLPYI
jgi:hypothetical protein